jgi:hypothetical protein
MNHNTIKHALIMTILLASFFIIFPVRAETPPNGRMDLGIVENSPWVYPTTEASPTTTSYYKTLLTTGPNHITLVLWNHDNNYDFVNGKFVIAIKSGLAQITSSSVNLGFDTQDLTGTTSPTGSSLPPGGIFPCPWKQYNVGTTLTDWQSPNGLQGTGDSSGIQVNVDVTAIGDPASVHLYFMAWGYKSNGQYTDSPYSHITDTFSPPNQQVPEVPLGPIIATVSMVAAFGVFYGFKKQGLHFPKL